MKITQSIAKRLYDSTKKYLLDRVNTDKYNCYGNKTLEEINNERGEWKYD